MTITRWLILYPLMAIVFLGLDMIWLGVVSQGYYAASLGSIMSPTVNWTAGFAFYAVFLLGIQYFVLSPGIKSDSFGRTALSGAFFGVVTYATHDLTNLATLRDWPLALTFVDMAWGAVLTASVSSCGYLLAKRIFKL